MRYHYEPPLTYTSKYGTVYRCDHPLYDICTLFKMGGRGLAVIQQRFDPVQKRTYWTEIDPWLNDDLYLQEGFYGYFSRRAKKPIDGLYPTVTIRQIMWGLKMRPLPKARWETVFDRSQL